jgi:DNA polymerase III epsilon subunit family exonuclease
MTVDHRTRTALNPLETPETEKSPQLNSQEQPKIPPPEHTFVVLDTETTGLDHKTEKLLEIAAVKIENGEVVETFSALIKPSVPIRYSSFLIHNISEEMVADAPSIDEVLPQFLEFIGDLPYVAHNAIFDYSFINEASKALLGKRFKNHRVDTFEMYRSVFPEEPSHGLSALLERFGFESTVKHRALDDAMALAKVYLPLRRLYEQKFSWQLSQIRNIQYLVERYLRVQRTAQILQAEMSDLKEIFKLYFQEGGKPVEATTGEIMVSSYKRSYDYDESMVWPVLLEAGLAERAYKLNPRVLDKLLDNGSLNEGQRDQIKASRRSMNESRTVTFLKPQVPTLAEDSEAAAP